MVPGESFKSARRRGSGKGKEGGAKRTRDEFAEMGRDEVSDESDPSRFIFEHDRVRFRVDLSERGREGEVVLKEVGRVGEQASN